MRKRRREGGRRTGHHYIYYFRFYWGGRKERRGVALQLKGLRHQKSHVHCPCPRGGAKLPGSASPGGRSRNAGLQPRPATTHRPTQEARNNQNENQTKKHTPKSRAPPLPSPKPELLMPATLPPKNKPKLFCSFFFSFLLLFFFQKFWVFWSAGCGSAGQPFPPPLPPFWAPPIAAASPLILSPRTAQPSLCRALEDGRRT